MLTTEIENHAVILDEINVLNQFVSEELEDFYNGNLSDYWKEKANGVATLVSIISEKINEAVLTADILLRKADKLSGNRNENSAKDNES